MSTLAVAGILTAAFFAMNQGASNSAAEMSAAYGAGLRSKKQALLLILVFNFAGAVLAGGAVIKTVGKGIAPEAVFVNNVHLVLVVLLVAGLCVFCANLLRVPIATTHATVAAVAGVGLYYHSLAWNKILEIVMWWLITPIASLFITFVLGRFFYIQLLNFISSMGSEEKVTRIMALLVTASGCYVAFTTGANNSANSMGPIVAANLVELQNAQVMAGVLMGVGALLFGGRILDAVGKEITTICPTRAVLLETVGATIILVASVKGIPVSLNEIVTSGIIGFSCASHGIRFTGKKNNVRRIALTWISTPFVACTISYCVISLTSRIFR